MTQKQGLKTRNHYIPQMLLKNFSTNNEVFTFSKVEQDWIQFNNESFGSSTKGTGYEKGLYVYKDINGKKNDSLETLFNQYETPTDFIFQKIIQNKHLSFSTPIDSLLTDEEIVDIMFFIVLFFNKTAFSIDTEALENYKILKSILEKNSLPDVGVIINKTGVFANKFFELMNNPIPLQTEVDNFLNHNWFVINNKEHDLKFILSDTLLVRTQENDIFLPIGSNHLLYGTLKNNIKFPDEKIFIKNINYLSSITYYQYLYYNINCKKMKRLILNNKNDNRTNINSDDLINLIDWEKEIKKRNIHL